jgi:acetoin utilization deacetylase AcuC-like enzyme
MTLALVTHPACLDHDTGPGHPERIDRLRAVLAAIDSADLPGLIREEAPRASVDQLCAVHDRALVERLLALDVPEGDHIALDADTVVSHGSIEAALRAAGAAVRGVDMVIGGEARAVFAAVRPPGHHAEPDRPMGFCLFNNVAIAARHAQNSHGLARIAVADFDVHHGNGTQAAFWDDPGLFFASSHQSPLYPGSGEAWERGAAGNIANAPLAPGSGSREFRNAWSRDLLPAIDMFAPELLIVSAGFDGHGADPLAQLRLEADDFAWLTGELVALAGRHCSGRIVSSLEGGYDLDALAQSVLAHLAVLAGGPADPQ